LREKRSGKPIAAKARPKGENVVDLMDTLKRSIANGRGSQRARGHARPQRDKEMLLPISGMRAAKVEAKKDKPVASRARKRA
jgi:DNA end-binding protein Ku